jgi:hypothetical protein
VTATTEKLLALVHARIGLDLLDEIDEFQRALERAHGRPLSRSIVLRELIVLGMAAARAGWRPASRASSRA